MKPYTLEWWMDKLDYHQNSMRNCKVARIADVPGSKLSWQRLYMYHYEMYNWIYNRIINKYGEK